MHLLDPYPTLSKESLELIVKGEATSPQYLLQDFSEEDAHKLAKSLKQSPKNLLLYLFFAPKSPYAPALAVFLDDLNVLDNPRGLNLNSVKLNSVCLQILSKLISHDKLNFISIDNCQTPYADIEPILMSASKSNVLTGLECDRNKIGNSGAKVIGEILANSTTLKRLSISSNEIMAEGGFELAKGLSKNQSVQIVDLAGNKIPANAVQQICESLISRDRSAHVKKLNLSCMGLTDSSTAAICSLIEKTQIEELNLSGNFFTKESLKAFTISVKKSSTIKHFLVRSNRFFPGHDQPHDPDFGKFPEQKKDLDTIESTISRNRNQ
ncbi:MAG: hypothetical protein M3R00_03745 [Pseudomonadota bacterium]|nr:hypothetical protein [Pseudomonadota bacterium]